MIKKKVIIIILVFAALVATGFYFGYRKNYFSRNPGEKKLPPTEIKSPILKNDGIINGFKLYKNSEFGFEIQYPVSWTVTEEINENVRGEMVKEFFFKKPNSDLRFAILPRDGLSYGVGATGTSTPVYIGGSPGMQTKYVLKDGRRLWLLFPQTGLLNWLEDLGRIDAMTSAEDPIGDSRIFEQMLSSFKLAR